IHSSPHTRDAELEENESGQSAEPLPKNVDLHYPCIALRLQHVETAVSRNGPECFRTAGGKEAVNRRGVPRAGYVYGDHRRIMPGFCGMKAGMVTPRS